MAAIVKHIQTATLDIAYEESGPSGGAPVFLMHGWPYDPRVYDDVVPILAAAGCRCIVPYQRGFGPTRFLSAATPRSGEQAALGSDLRDLMDVLGIARAVLAGYDWGGRAACVVAALWPERVKGLLTGDGYNMINVEAAGLPADVEQEHRFWYQYYFQLERGRAGLTKNRRELIRLLWTLWSPNWAFDDATFARSAPSFDNPDFVDVTIQAYRFRHGNAPGDPALEALAQRLNMQPPITVPTIVLHGEGNGVSPMRADAAHLIGKVDRRLIAKVGHNLPAEAPGVFADAVIELVSDAV
jgi:pimeloyl-ACP methyl ester carboxylesterase